VEPDRLPVPSLSGVALHGDRVKLREVRVDDATDALAWSSDREWFRYLAHEPVDSLDQEQAFFHSLLADTTATPRRTYHLGITTESSDTIIGLARLGVTSERHYAADLGYGIRRDLWGNGITTEAVKLLIGFGFDQLGLHRIWAHHHPDNVASERVLQKVGMTKEGRLRDNMLTSDGWRDSNLYAILEDEWANNLV